MTHHPAPPRFKLKTLACLPLLFAGSAATMAAPSVVGTSGLINMPDAHIAPEGTLSSGYSYFKPYGLLWTDLAFLPWLEGTFRYTRIANVPAGFTEEQNKTYGSYKDKSLGAKLALPESKWFPALAVGKTDLTGVNAGTQLYSSRYVTASKNIGLLDLTVGYGKGRIDGPFGGARLQLSEKLPLSLVAEYDANNYAQDIGSSVSGSDRKKKGPSVGLEYRWGWLGTQLSYQHNTVGINGYVSVPLDMKEFVPKIDEPEPWAKPVPRPTVEQWKSDPSYKARAIEALYGDDFRAIRLAWRDGVLDVALTNRRISAMSRAVGRAARILMMHSPDATREIRITYSVNELPAATYRFYDLDALQKYFYGLTPRSRLARSVSVELAAPGSIPDSEAEEALQAAAEAHPESVFHVGEDVPLFALRTQDKNLNQARVRPYVSFFFNDPSGALKYDFSLLGSMGHSFGSGWSTQGAVQWDLVENVSDVTQASNSDLPHVRTDVAEYKKGAKFKLSRLLLNKYVQLDKGLYARASTGVYEEMFAGAGTQIAYFPERGPWAADLAVDWVRQRDTEGWFGLRDYSTTTAIASLHYQLPMNLTGTMRAGRFLARDDGVRLELSRRFQSGVEVGAWYTVTNGNDITQPGSPGSPYHDKGMFISIPLNSMLTKDTQASGGFAIAPWTRDVGQMVASPGDLYSLFERSLVHGLFHKDGLSRFGDVDDDYATAPRGKTMFDLPLGDLAARDASALGSLALKPSSWAMLATATGLTLLAAKGDNSVDRYSSNHMQGSVWNKIGNGGNAIPYGALAMGGLAAFSGLDDNLTLVGASSLEAGASALVVASGLKYAAGRARPKTGADSHTFESGSSNDSNASFPSGHTMIAWAALTPFAKAYDAPWLYGFAAMTNVARIQKREHWLSDTVASSFIGYALGSLTWSWRKKDNGAPDTVSVTPNGVAAQWSFK
ncbi:YjbH domain-containing protein [Niveibacterium terrae]|uniref:YjbH domain-containing protein n=1 Tax=Niveibacterium terrae TaxID=3373598 RepID=UPI003A9264F4